MLQRSPGTGELVIIGVDAVKPFTKVGIISGMLNCIHVYTSKTYFERSNLILQFS